MLTQLGYNFESGGREVKISREVARYAEEAAGAAHIRAAVARLPAAAPDIPEGMRLQFRGSPQRCHHLPHEARHLSILLYLRSLRVSCDIHGG